MTNALILVFRLLLWLALAPMLPGLINKVKAWVAGRRGPPVLQLYYDLAKLWRKGVVMSDLASPGFVIGPAVAWVAILAAAMLVPLIPLGSNGAALSFRGDVFLLIYLLARSNIWSAGVELPLSRGWRAGCGGVRVWKVGRESRAAAMLPHDERSFVVQASACPGAGRATRY